MKLCGLTGGVGMGKSTAAGFFLASEVRIIDTDEIAHDLVKPGRPALAEIEKEFGRDVMLATGGLNRAELARRVFSRPEALSKLEAILHPRIRDCWQAQVEAWRRQDCPVAMVVIPLLFETQSETSFDRVICVACSAASQRERLHARGWPPAQIEGRIAAQMAVGEKMARSHFVLWTEGSLASHQQQVDRILRRV